jgi:F-type H+-transporting ATPase subunit b
MKSAGKIAGKFRPAGLVFLLTFAVFACGLPTSSACFAVESSAEGEHAGGGHETGVPMVLKRDLALWSLVVFFLFLWVLGKFAWKPMIEGLDKREAGIRSAIAEAEQNRKKAEAMLADYQKQLREAEQHVAAMIAEARRDAERTSQDLIAGAQREVDLLRQRTRDEIRQAKDAALADVFSQLNAQVVLATEHVLGRALQDSDQERLVTEALASIAR